MDESQPIQSTHQNNMRHHRSGSRTPSPSVTRPGWAGHLALCCPRHYLVYHIPDLVPSLTENRGRDASPTRKRT